MTTNNRHFLNTNKDNKNMRDMFTVNHTGKMSGMLSLSTSPLMNNRCKARAACGNSECICTHCYALAMQDMYDALSAKLMRNTEALTSELVPGSALPTINPDRHPAARIEAFGDLVNETQVINYIDLISTNPDVYFGWWTKNPDIIAEALYTGEYEKPENVKIIYSNPIIDKYVSLEEIQTRYPFIDAVFTVWSDEKTAAAHGQAINCGARHCMTCKKCYTNNGIAQINELLK